jgi:ribosomal 50S subunit-recycling heat shock protein
MRIDKYLNATNITKRRAISQDMIDNKVVLVNDMIVKASKRVEVGDVITINYLETQVKYKVLKIPTNKSIPKSLQMEYIEIL